MFSLICNELVKVKNKKSTLILLIISFIYILFTNIIYNNNLIDVNYTFNDILINFFNEYELLIIVIISFISSNILIEEYRGTVKQLLITPYSRTKILLSKIICMFIILLFYLIFIIILQLLLGIILLDKSSYSYIYEFKVINYFILLILSKIPLFIFISFTIILLSTFINSNILTIIITLFFYIFSPIFTSISNKISIFKYFITEHIDFSNYIIDSTHILTSICIYFIYIILIIILSLMIFKNKEIKNL